MSVQAVRLAACPVGKHCDEVWPPRPNGKRHQLTRIRPPESIAHTPPVTSVFDVCLGSV